MAALPPVSKADKAIDGVLDALLRYRRRHAREQWATAYIILLVDEALLPATTAGDRLSILHEIAAILHPPVAS